MRIAAEQNLTQQLGGATSRPQAALFKQFLLPLDYRRQAWAPIVLVLDVIVTFSLDGPLRIRTYRSYILDI
jgi:hypothetical protein